MIYVYLVVQVMFTIQLGGIWRSVRVLVRCFRSKKERQKKGYDSKYKVDVKIPVPAKVVGNLAGNER